MAWLIVSGFVSFQKNLRPDNITYLLKHGTGFKQKVITLSADTARDVLSGHVIL